MCWALCAGAATLCWLLNVITRECSWVDRLWSIVPVVYAGVFAWSAGFADLRANVMATLVLLWGARLTFNFARKGGYQKGGEDYRWEELRKRMSPAAFQLFSLTFIAGFQNVLLLLIVLPMHSAMSTGAPFGVLDAVLAVLFLVFLAGETIADQQQWVFHQAKKARRARGEDGPEFLTTGLFAYSRHPNFFCEQAQWWVLAMFPFAAGAGIDGVYTLLGAAILSALFHGSTRFTEELSLKKYPSYADYQKRVSRLLPLPSRA